MRPRGRRSVAHTNVIEGSGSPATFGIITRTPVNSRDLAVILSATPNGQLSLPSRVTIPANQASASFNINVPDDNLVNGARVVAITAKAFGDTGLLLESSAGSASIQIEDNDGPTLTVSLTSDVVAEGATVINRCAGHL